MFKHSKSVGMLLTTFGLTTFGIMSANAIQWKQVLKPFNSKKLVQVL